MQNSPLHQPLPLQMTPCSSWQMFWAAPEQTVKEKRAAIRLLLRGGPNTSLPKGEGYRVGKICEAHLCQIIL